MLKSYIECSLSSSLPRIPMRRALFPLCLLTVLAVSSFAQESADQQYPPSSAIAEGVSPEILAELDSLVQSFVDDDEIVGAELHVIKNGKSILHEAYGMSDREAGKAMETNSVFCVRSMTKPFIGASILMLIEENRIELDDLISKYIPAFDVESTKDITIEHLLTHTSGLPLSLILGKGPENLQDIQHVAGLGAGTELEFEPGTNLNYSDQGTDTLAAVVEIVAGEPVGDFVRKRLLEPLGMTSSATVMTEGSPLRERGTVKYIGSKGAWSSFWTPADDPLFPFFLGSQGLYSTTTDYARFLELWASKGRIGKERLLDSRYVRKAMSPTGYKMGASALAGAQPEYGYLMQLWMGEGKDGKAGKRPVVAFGHTGSDGTHAYYFPKHKTMVLYFTQSRGGQTSLQVEEVLSNLLLGVHFDPNQAAPPFEEYLGYYWEGKGDLYRSIIRDGEDLALEVVGRGVAALGYMGDDRWKMKANPSVVLEFNRGENGIVTGYNIKDHYEYRFEASDDLPSLEEISARVREAHGFDNLETVGSVRLTWKFKMPKLGMEADQVSLLQWPNRYRVDTNFPAMSTFENVAFDGEKVWYETTGKAIVELEGDRAMQVQNGSPFARYGDWSERFPNARVIQRYKAEGKDCILVRMGDTSSTAATYMINEETGHLMMEANVVHMEQMGRMGHFIGFADFRDVSGIQLPFQLKMKMANPLIGSIEMRVLEYKVGVEVPEGMFQLLD
jgi:CubicO group peptidase (beta-lactamase class C family)